MLENSRIKAAMKLGLGEDLPEPPPFDPSLRRAPDRGYRLSKEQTVVALKNALRYIPEKLHAVWHLSSLRAQDQRKDLRLQVPAP